MSHDCRRLREWKGSQTSPSRDCNESSACIEQSISIVIAIVDMAVEPSACDPRGYGIYRGCWPPYSLIAPLHIAIVAVEAASAVVAIVAIVATVVVIIVLIVTVMAVVAVGAIVGHRNYRGCCGRTGCHSCRNCCVTRECKQYGAKSSGEMTERVKVDRVRRDR